MIVLQLNSGGSVDVDVEPLLRDVRGSRVPVVVWVGPSGAKAKGAATLLAESAPVLSVSSGSSIGPADPLRLDQPDQRRQHHRADVHRGHRRHQADLLLQGRLPRHADVRLGHRHRAR